MSIGAIDFGVVILYLIVMILIALYFAKKKIDNFDDYLLAGGKLPVAVLIATFTSTYFGVDSLSGNSEMGFSMGVSGFFSYCFVAWILMIVLAFIGFKIKDRLGNYKTTIDLIADTYGPVTRICTAIGSIAYTTPIVNVMGMGIAFSIVLGVPYWVGVLISGIIATGYTYFGGLAAVSVTDTINFVIIAVGVAVLGFVGWRSMGTEAIWDGLETFAGMDPSFYWDPSGGWLTGGLMLTYAVTALSVLCEPTLFQRIFASKDGKSVRNALLIGSCIYLSYAVISTVIGTLAAAGTGLGMLENITASESLIGFAVEYLPIGMVGLFLAGFLAAGISTCDSMLLVAGSNLAYDLYRPFTKKEIPEEQYVKITRAGVVIASIVSILLCFAFGRLMSAWVFVASLLANTTLVPLYTALFLPGKKSKLAGEISAAVGLIGTLGLYLGIYFFGYYDEAWGTNMIDINLFGNTFAIWQEYNILIVLPITIIVYFIVHVITRPNRRQEA